MDTNEKQRNTNSRNSRSIKYPNKSQYAGKVKCYTLKSVQNPPNSSENRLMLGLKDPNVDAGCEYEQRSVVTKHKRPRMDFQQGDQTGSSRLSLKRSGEPSRFVSYTSMNEQDSGSKGYSVIMPENDFEGSPNIMIDQGQDHVSKSDKRAEESKEIENTITFYSSSDQNEGNSKDFMGSIGSWINDLFSVPNKRLCTEQKTGKVEIQKEQSLEEDPEYLKSISAIKEQFRKKLKNETSVHLTTSDKPFEYHFYKVLDNGRKSDKVMKSIPSSKSTEILEELNNLNYEKLERLPEKANRNSQNLGFNFRVSQKENIMQPLNNTSLMNCSNLVKKRRISRKNRSEGNKLEEYVLPSASELSKRILLNINEQDKCLQFYKNPQIGVQESQHYNPRKSKPCQSNTRCYTTNANITESSENFRSKAFITANRASDCFTGDALETKGEEEFFSGKSSPDPKKSVHRKISVKAPSEPPKDMLTVVKTKPGKAIYNPQSEFLRNELKASSDELVRYLMKKVKVNTRPQQKKKTALNMSPVINSPKSRFMQSATNSLVLSVMAKKENEFRLPADTKAVKVSTPTKEVAPGNVRFDVSRAINQNKFNRTSYLLENDKDEEDCFLFGKNNYKNTKLMNDITKKSEKYPKRHELKHMLSKLDMKFNVLNPTKPKPKEKAKPLKNVFEELDAEDSKDSSNPRFLKQHERFKNNIKTAQDDPDPIIANGTQEERKIEEPPQPTPVSTEVALVNTDVQMTLANLREKNVVVTEQPVKVPSVTDEAKVSELLAFEESNIKIENKAPVKPILPKDRFKTNPHKYLKGCNSNSVLNPLPKYYSPELQNQNETQCEPPLCPPDLRPVKSMEKLFLNRRYSTNTLTTLRKNKRPPLVWPPMKCSKSPGGGTRKDIEGDKREAKEKDKLKSPNKNESTDKVCGFEKMVKKPGPNCENEEKSKP